MGGCYDNGKFSANDWDFEVVTKKHGTEFFDGIFMGDTDNLSEVADIKPRLKKIFGRVLQRKLGHIGGQSECRVLLSVPDTGNKKLYPVYDFMNRPHPHTEILKFLDDFISKTEATI